MLGFCWIVGGDWFLNWKQSGLPFNLREVAGLSRD